MVTKLNTTTLTKDESFNNKMTTEKVHYKGELRIVGQVVNQLSDKEPIGYVIMVEKTYQCKLYTVEQTKALLGRFKFVNAALENGKIINTECAMSRMPKFNTNMQVIGNHGIIILGEIIDGNRKIGYRAMDTNARVVDIEEHEIVRLSSNGVDVINAKIVKRENRDTVSAIKSEFTKIEKSKLNEVLTSRKITKTQKWRNEQHIRKILGYGASVVLTQIFTKSNISRINFSDNWAWRESDDMYGRFYEPLKEYKIFCKEIATEANDCKLSDSDKEILRKVGELPRQDRLNYCKESMSNDTKYFMLAFLQLALNNPNVYSRTLYQIKKCRYHLRFETAKLIVDNGLDCESFRKLIVDAQKIYKDAQELRNSNNKNGRVLRRSASEKEFKTKTFTTGKEIAQLGFTISEENRGVRYRTDYGYTKTLLYIGDMIGGEATGSNKKYKEVSRCLGDLISIAYIEKLLNKLDNGEAYIDEVTMTNSIIVLITIAFMFNSEAMKMYVEDRREDLEYHLGEIPVYEEIAGVDYKLNSWITMYYASGFNVFLSDDDTYQYKHTHLANSEIINYRQLGVRHNIIHPMLQNDFASVVSLVAPETISSESITEIIGQLRFL